MYIKKSIISGVVLVIGVMILLAVTFVYGFTEIPVSGTTCAVIWAACIFGGMKLTDMIEHIK